MYPISDMSLLCAIGVDIGGTHTKLGVVEANGVILHFRKIPTEARGGLAAYLDRIFTEIQHLLELAGPNIAGIGVAMHGHLDLERRGPILCNNTPDLRSVDMKGHLQERFDYPVVINNDLTAHALAEYRYGSGQGFGRFLCLVLGTGLGVGVMVSGEPVRFIEGTAGDVGRLVIEPTGPEDAYGVRGSAEALCGVPGIERLAKARYGMAKTAYEVINAARLGHDPIAIDIMQQIGKYVGHTLALVCPIYLPQRIALTGGTTEAGEVLLAACRERFLAMLGGYYQHLATLAPAYYREPEIVVGKLRSEAGLIGAVVELFEAN
jgi:glucokinase